MDNNKKIICPNCGKEYKVIEIARQKMSSSSYNVVDVEEGTLLWDIGKPLECPECKTIMIQC